MKKANLDYTIKARLPITVIIVLMAFTVTYFVSRSERDGLGYEPDQPVNYSHKLHAGDLQIDCKYCHIAVDKGRHASVPSVDICMNCHTIAKVDSPEIQKLTAYYKNNKPLPWEQIHKTPEYCYFNHSVHINKGIDCENCHEAVERMEKVSQVHSFTMGSCLFCHRHPVEKMPQFDSLFKAGGFQNGPTHCGACHR